MRSVEEMAKEVDATKGNRMPQLLSELGSERDEVYEALSTKPEVPPVEEPKEPEAPVETKEPEKSEFVAEPPKEEKKVVPLDALHEERARRKELSKRVKELEDTVKLQMEDNKKLLEALQKPDDEPITDYEKEMLSLRKQLKMAMGEIENFKKAQVKDREVSAQERLEAMAKATDSELSKDGFDGFYDFIPQVVKAMNDEEIPLEDRSPDTWKRVYREVVYPKYVGKFKQVAKDTKKEEKKELKKDASLIKEPGKAEAKKKEDDDFDYMKFRSRQSFFNNPL